MLSFVYVIIWIKCCNFPFAMSYFPPASWHLRYMLCPLTLHSLSSLLSRSHNLSCSRSPTHTHTRTRSSVCVKFIDTFVQWCACWMRVDSLSSQQTSCMIYGCKFILNICMYLCMYVHIYVCSVYVDEHCTLYLLYIHTYLLMYIVHMYRRVCFVYTPASAYECEYTGTIKGESERQRETWQLNKANVERGGMRSSRRVERRQIGVTAPKTHQWSWSH